MRTMLWSKSISWCSRRTVIRSKAPWLTRIRLKLLQVRLNRLTFFQICLSRKAINWEKQKKTRTKSLARPRRRTSRSRRQPSRTKSWKSKLASSRRSSTLTTTARPYTMPSPWSRIQSKWRLRLNSYISSPCWRIKRLATCKDAKLSTRKGWYFYSNKARIISFFRGCNKKKGSAQSTWRN